MVFTIEGYIIFATYESSGASQLVFRDELAVMIHTCGTILWSMCGDIYVEVELVLVVARRRESISSILMFTTYFVRVDK